MADSQEYTAAAYPLTVPDTTCRELPLPATSVANEANTASVGGSNLKDAVPAPSSGVCIPVLVHIVADALDSKLLAARAAVASGARSVLSADPGMCAVEAGGRGAKSVRYGGADWGDGAWRKGGGGGDKVEMGSREGGGN